MINQFLSSFNDGEVSFSKRIFPAIACLSILSGTVTLSGWIWKNLLARSSLTDFGAKQGYYCVITGASDGIGRALALEGAKRGFHLVLISRSLSKLQELKTEIVSKYPTVDVVLIDVDCSDCLKMDENINRIVSAVQSLKISVLWNNVGVTTVTPLSLANISSDEMKRILTVNVEFTTLLTAALIPLFKQQTIQTVIVNLSSFLSILPAVNYVPYSSTKAYINQFTSALFCELEQSNILVTSMRPAHVATTMSGIKECSLMVPSPETWANCAWNKLGVSVDIVPYLPHAFQEILANVFPSSFIRASLRAAICEPKAKEEKK